MNWFDTSGLTSLAKTALKEAQKTIDKALDIQDESGEEEEDASAAAAKASSAAGSTNTPQKENSDFFASWGLTVSAESAADEESKEQPVVTESPSKSSPQTMWGSFAGSFFDPGKSDDLNIVRPPKAKSMNVITDSKSSSQDDLFSKSQLVMSDDGSDIVSVKPVKADERRSSTRSQQLSLVSSYHSSDSVEILSQSLKTTPDSPSAQSVSHSSSLGHKINSESVEILPDSLVSPSSIECLGFDSNSSPSSNLSPDLSDKKSTPLGEKTERIVTADSVSLVADDDEDTISYNSISECTAPTVLDTEEQSSSPYPKALRSDIPRKEFLHLEQPQLAQRIQISENSSNDGSWSDRTLNADNDSINLDTTLEEQKKDETEDVLMEKLSDSSSFYNVNVSSSEMIRSASSAFVNVEKQQCHEGDSRESSQKDGSVKERISPISSDSKSDLVKIGSDRTSGHTSGDELETTTSSDIEIIPSPNGDNSHGSRSSPAKYAFKQCKFDGTTSPNLVDLVLGKSLATKIRGHNRELSEASVQSNTSDESQGSENDRLMRRLCEMAEILEARENRLMEMSRSNADLVEHNESLKSQVESLQAKHEGGDISTITEDYTQRMSALEKKFQQAIREKDQLRKQLDTMKEGSSRKNSSELENALKEKDDVIGQLQEEGEKLAKQQLQHSNIIKKLRAKEKDNEQVIKSLRDKISEQSSELERLKRAVAAKEELEVTQIEAVYRLTTHNKKLETELAETKSTLDDTMQRLESTRTSLDAASHELTELARAHADCPKRRDAHKHREEERVRLEGEAERARAELATLRAEMVHEEKRWVSRTEALRSELSAARERIAFLEGELAGGGACGQEEGVASLLAQLAQLQRARVDQERSHANSKQALQRQLAEAEISLAKAVEREKLTREENQALLERQSTSEGLIRDLEARLEGVSAQCQSHLERVQELERKLSSNEQELSSARADWLSQQQSLQAALDDATAALERERERAAAERTRGEILQEQMSARGDVSPPHSVASDSLSASLWAPDDGMSTPTPPHSAPPVSTSALCVQEALSTLSRREGELRALHASMLRLRREKDSLRALVARLQADLDEYRAVQEQYDALLQMYGEKEEQLAEVRLDLQDVTQLYKQQLDELIALRQQQQQHTSSR